MNVGGNKINPEKIEALAQAFEGVKDAGVCLIERLPGIEELAIAIVGTEAVNLRALDQMLRAKLPNGHPTVFTTAQHIPRNRMGKIVREDLRRQILSDLNLD
jgi:acyl-coenzyme A synthetase/AMP-(fatty) acid ligase